MKPNEIIDEGIWDTVKRGFAKKGWMGKTAQSAAYLSQAEEESAALKQAEAKQRLANWLKILPAQIIKAYRAGMVTLPESMTIDYNDFDRLLENKIKNSSYLTEADNLASFMRKYIDKIARQRGVEITPDMDSAITGHINDFVRNFGVPPADIEPEEYKLPFPAVSSASKIWDVLSTADITQQPGKAAPSAPAAEPTGDVPDDKASGGLWTPEGAKNSYTYDARTKVWMMHRPAPAGSPSGSSPMPSQVRDPRMIEKLNKLWAEQGESLE